MATRVGRRACRDACVRGRVVRTPREGAELAPRIIGRYPHLAKLNDCWRPIEEAYLPMIEGRYEADLAYAFLNSVQRMIHQGEWQPVEYAFGQGGHLRSDPDAGVYREVPGGPTLSPQAAAEILSIPNFAAGYRDKEEDAYLIAERVDDWLGAGGDRRRAGGRVRERWRGLRP